MQKDAGEQKGIAKNAMSLIIMYVILSHFASYSNVHFFIVSLLCIFFFRIILFPSSLQRTGIFSEVSTALDWHTIFCIAGFCL